MIGEKYIVTIGRPSYQKNPFFLVDVISDVNKRHPDVKFFLQGVGFYSPDLEIMKKKIEEKRPAGHNYLERQAGSSSDNGVCEKFYHVFDGFSL